MEQLEILKKGLDKATKSGVFSLEESSLILTNYVQLKNALEIYVEAEKEPQSKPLEKVDSGKQLKEKK